MSGQSIKDTELTVDTIQLITWIAHFGATVENLQTVFELSSDSVESELDRAERLGYIEQHGEAEPTFYLATPAGMRRGGLERWASSLWLRSKGQDEVRLRAVAAVAAAQAVLLRLEEGYGDKLEVKSTWWLRSQGRWKKGRPDKVGRYKYEVAAIVGEERQRYLPPVILAGPDEGHNASQADESSSVIEDEARTYEGTHGEDGFWDESDTDVDGEFSDMDGELSDSHEEFSDHEENSYIDEDASEPGVVPILVDVFPAIKSQEEMRSIIVNRVKQVRKDQVSFVMCYVLAEQLDILWKVIVGLKAQDEIYVYRLSPGAQARDLITQRREQVPVAEGLLTTDGVTAQLRILECFGEFEAASTQAIVEYLEIDRDNAQWLIDRAVDEGLVSESVMPCKGVRVYWLTAEGIKQVKMEIEPVKLDEREARRAKERLRTAAKLQKGQGGQVIRSVSRLRHAGECKEIPTVVVSSDGRASTMYADLTVHSKAASSERPIAGVLVLERNELKAMPAILRAWAVNEEVSEVYIYVERKLLAIYKELTVELDIADRITIRSLPKSEQAIMEEYQKAESLRKAQLAQRAQVHRSKAIHRHKREWGPKIKVPSEYAKPRRSLVVDPELAGAWLINDTSAEIIAGLLKEQGLDIEKWVVHWRLIVNLAVWLCVARKAKVEDLATKEHGVTRNTFEKRVFQMHDATVWDRIPDILAACESDRPKVKWSLIEVDTFLERNKFTGRTEAGDRAVLARSEIEEKHLNELVRVQGSTAELDLDRTVLGS